jgi:hypothetical protein
MKDKDCFRGFIQLSRAWYGETSLRCRSDINDEITFGYYYSDRSTAGEISVGWLCLIDKPTPLIRIYSDAWSALSEMKDLIDLLAQHDNEDPTPEQFCEYLKQCGFKDMTEEKREK